MFKIYKASAGAGKTTNLVKEYLLLCLKNLDNYKHVLAVTFTNNATAEMKERILNILYDFSFGDMGSCYGSTKYIAEELVQTLYGGEGLGKAEAYDKLKERSRQLLENILYDYSNFSISTIDSFFQRIIRAFALELGINMNFSLQIELDDVYEQTLDTLLNRISADNRNLSNRVLQLVRQELDESGKLQIEKDLLSVISYLQEEKSFLPISYLQQQESRLEQLKENLKRKKKDLSKAIEDTARHANSLLDGRIASDFHKGKLGIFTFFDKILKNPTALPGHGNIDSVIQEKGSFTKIPNAVLFEELKSAYEFMCLNVPKMNPLDDILRNLKRVHLLLDLKEIMDEIRERDNLFYLSESNTKIYNEIRGEESPYIYEKLGNKYAYFFIDEFQDTSKMQWEDFIPLLKNALSQPAPHTHGHETGDVILFGDVKQAIYRFRNGDASLLQNLSRNDGSQYAKMRYGREMEVNNNEFCLEELKVNRRSSHTVISFNNAFFQFLSGKSEDFPGASDFYSDVNQVIPSENGKEGLVAVRFKDPDPQLSWNDFAANAVWEAVREAHDIRHYQYRDIAVLSSSNAQTSMLGRFLAEQNIPVISKESLLLSSSQKIQFLIAVFTYLAHPDDAVSQLLIIKYLHDKGFFAESMSDLLDRLNGENATLEQLLQSVFAGLDMNLWKSLPLLTSLKEICRVFDLDATQDAFLIAFFNAVLSEWPLGNENILVFFDWWEKKSPKLSIASSNEVDAVTLCTVHSSKGLEYPVMVFPIEKYNTSVGRPGGKNFYWVKNPDFDESKSDTEMAYYLITLNKSLTQGTEFEKVWEEEQSFAKMDSLNMLYVAQTRARDIMYILTNAKPDELILDPDLTGNVAAASSLPQNARKKPNYAEMMYEFIQSTDFYKKVEVGGSKRNIAFEQDKENPRLYWFGDRTCKNQNEIGNDKPEDNKLQSFDFPSFTPADWLLDTSKVASPQQEKGVFIHDFLAALSEFPQDETELKRCLSTVPAHYVADVEAALRKIMDDAALKPYFDKDVKTLNERNIAFMSNGEMVLRRPDRIVFREHEVMVIDYKTGTPKERDELQIQEYCSLLRQMGYDNVHYRILYF